jgi:predicted nucleotidyltransferase
LKKLVEDKLIIKDKQKSNTFYSLKLNDITFNYFTRFDILKFNDLHYSIKIPLKELIEKINNIKCVIYFGSTSNGTYRDESDIDLLIVTSHFENNELNKLYQIEIRKKIENLQKLSNALSVYHFSCFFVSENDLINDKDDDLVINIKKTGYPIYGQFEYNKIKQTKFK